MFKIGGLASGIDSSTLIEQLMLFERKPLTLLEQRKTQLTSKNSALQSINTRLTTLRSRLTDLTLEKNMKPKQVTSSKGEALTASAGAGSAEGTYKVKVNRLATSTSVGSTGTISDPALGGTKLSELLPAEKKELTIGTFTLGGASFEILDADATLDDVIAAINVAGGKPVDASYRSGMVAVLDSNGNPYTPAPGDPDLPNWSGLGPAAASLVDGRIQLNVAGDADGSVAIGSGGDTSNFLSLVGLKSPIVAGDTRTGARLNVAQLYNPLNEDNDVANGANLATAVKGDADGNGAFKVNGIEVAYNVKTDSLADILNRINASSAGVVASYNAIEDRIVLNSKTTGNTAIGLEEVNGNFLEAVGLKNASQQMGTNASISIDGIAGEIESATNEFKGILPGVVFTAKKATAGETVEADKWVSVSVAANPDGTINTIKSFINDFNATVDAIEAAQADGKPLENESALRSILSRLYRLVYEPIEGVTEGAKTLSGIGIGTSKDDRKHLTINEEKLRAALRDNPDRVAQLFNKGTATDNPTGVAGRMKAYLEELGGKEGIFAARKNSTERQTKYLNNQIEAYERRIEQRRQILTQQFTAMERSVALMQSQQSAMMSQLGSLQTGR